MAGNSCNNHFKTGGYQRFSQMAEKIMADGVKPWDGIDVEALEKLAEDAKKDPRHVKISSLFQTEKRGGSSASELLFCSMPGRMSHSSGYSGIHWACRRGKYADALRAILDKNALPFITGTLCAHNCMYKCTRNFYDESVNIRGTKLLAAENGYDEVIGEIRAGESNGKK